MGDLSNFIDGDLCPPASAAWSERGRAPDGGSPLDRVPLSDERDIARALEVAEPAQRSWAATSPLVRGDVLRALARTLRERAGAIAECMSAEIGKPIGEGHGEVVHAARVFDFFGGLSHELGGETIPSARDGVQLLTRREPLGTVGIITPWNFPVNLAAIKMAPALLSGNAVVWKPASPAATSSSLFVDCFAEANVPAGLVAMLLGDGRSLGAALTGAGVDAISFTGSTIVGRSIERRSAEQGIRALTELGGKNAVVILPDADLDAAVQAVVDGAFRYSGQKCTATSRLILLESVAPPFLEQLLERVAGLKVGVARDPATFLGPLISEASLKSSLAFVAEAVTNGAQVRAGGARAEVAGFADGWFMRPTVLTGVTADMRIAREEVFGPVLAVLVARDLDEAASITNATDYGLSASIFTNDLAAAFAFADRADVGAVQVNLPTTGLEYQTPVGGRRASGSGGVEGGTAALDFYSRMKTVAIRHT